MHRAPLAATTSGTHAHTVSACASRRYSCHPTTPTHTHHRRTPPSLEISRIQVLSQQRRHLRPQRLNRGHAAVPAGVKALRGVLGGQRLACEGLGGRSGKQGVQCYSAEVLDSFLRQCHAQLADTRCGTLLQPHPVLPPQHSSPLPETGTYPSPAPPQCPGSPAPGAAQPQPGTAAAAPHQQWRGLHKDVRHVWLGFAAGKN